MTWMKSTFGQRGHMMPVPRLVPRVAELPDRGFVLGLDHVLMNIDTCGRRHRKPPSCRVEPAGRRYRRTRPPGGAIRGPFRLSTALDPRASGSKRPKADILSATSCYII